MHYDWEALASGVYRCRLPFLDVTVGLVVGDREVLIIDCGTTLFESRNVASDVHQICGRDVSRVLLTHHHFDHVLGVGTFAEAQIYAAPAVGRALVSGLSEMRLQAVGFGADADEIDRAVAAARPPDHQILNGELELGDRSVRIEQPGRGHTDHDLVVLVPGDCVVVFCGDLVEESADPSIDTESDVSAWVSALDRVLALSGPHARYVPGHGATVDAEFVRRQRDWLAARSDESSPTSLQHPIESVDEEIR